MCQSRDVLHDWRIDPREYARHEARRGRRHAFETFVPQRTAIVVIDMVACFVEANEYARGIVPNITVLAEAFAGAAARLRGWSRA